MQPAPGGATMALLANLASGPNPDPQHNMDFSMCGSFGDVNMDDLLLPLLDESALGDYSLDNTPFVTPYNSEPSTPFDSPVMRSLDPGPLNLPPSFSLGTPVLDNSFSATNQANLLQKLSANALFQNLLLGGMNEQPPSSFAPTVAHAPPVDVKPPPPVEQFSEQPLLFAPVPPLGFPPQGMGLYGMHQPAMKFGPMGMPMGPPFALPMPQLLGSQPRFSPYAPGLRRQVMFGEPVEATPDTRERNKYVHNVLERKRRKDLNDTFDQLATVLAQSKNVPTKLCKREVITDTIEHVQYLKQVNTNLNTQKESLTYENQQLVTRLKELKCR